MPNLTLGSTFDSSSIAIFIMGIVYCYFYFSDTILKFVIQNGNSRQLDAIDSIDKTFDLGKSILSIIQSQSVCLYVSLKLKISPTAEPIGFYSSGNIPNVPVMVLSQCRGEVAYIIWFFSIHQLWIVLFLDFVLYFIWHKTLLFSLTFDLFDVVIIV